MLVLEDLLYTEDHLWLRVLESGRVKVGITDYGQSLIAEFSDLDIPSPGEKLSEGDILATAHGIGGEVLEFLSPATGVVTLANNKLLDYPDIISDDPYEDGWLIEMKIDVPEELDDLMSSDDYESYVQELVIMKEEMPEEDPEDELEVIEK